MSHPACGEAVRQTLLAVEIGCGLQAMADACLCNAADCEREGDLRGALLCELTAYDLLKAKAAVASRAEPSGSQARPML